MTKEEIIEFCEMKAELESENEDIYEAIINVLEQADVLDKIREEIEQLPTTKCTETHRIYIDADNFKENVIAIVDKYIAESEEEE